VLLVLLSAGLGAATTISTPLDRSRIAIIL
jgi:hypothetical protein